MNREGHQRHTQRGTKNTRGDHWTSEMRKTAKKFRNKKRRQFKGRPSI